MNLLRRSFALLIPSPLVGVFALLAALTVGYVLWLETEPVPRGVVAFDGPEWEFFRHRISVSPDNRLLLLHYDEGFPAGARPPGRTRTDWVDFDTLRHGTLTSEIKPPFVFASDGKQIAGVAGDTVQLWDGGGGAEPMRLPFKELFTRKDFEPALAFLPEGLVVYHNWVIDRDGDVRPRYFNLKTNRPWNGKRSDFQYAYLAQQDHWPSQSTSADGKVTLAIGAEAVLTSTDGWTKEIAFPKGFESFFIHALAPDAKTIILVGESWRPFQTARDGIDWIYANGKDPNPTLGVLLLNVDTGFETAFLAKRSEKWIEVGILPNAKTFVVLKRGDAEKLQLTIYDWPLRKPWWPIGIGVALTFAGLILVCKAWRWIRCRRSNPEEIEHSTPPWESETDAGAKVDS